MGGMRRGVLLCAAIAIAACGDDAVQMDASMPPPDAGTGWTVAPPAAPEPPAPPAPPVLTPCPPGWREVTTRGGATVCDPWPEGGPARCPSPDEAHFPGEPGCVRVGTACPADGVPVGLPTDVPVLHVRAGAAAGGEGSLAAPFARITDALEAATDGAVVAVHRGTYDELVVLRRPVTLAGACVGDTSITSSTAGAAGLVSVAADTEVTIRNLGIGPYAGPGLRVLGTVALEDVVISDTERHGIQLERGAGLAGSRVVVRGVTERGSEPQVVGILAARTSQVDLRWSVIEDAVAGAAALGGSARLEDVAVRDVACGTVVAGAIEVLSESEATLERVAIDRICGKGLFTYGPATITARDVVVRSTRRVPGGDLQSGVALHVVSGDVTLERAWLADAELVPLVSLLPEAEAQTVAARLDDVVMTRSSGPAVDFNELAAEVGPRTTLEANRIQIEDVFGMQVSAGSASIADLTFRWSAPQSSDTLIGGVFCVEGAHVTLDRARFDNAGFAIAAGHPSATAGCTVSVADFRASDVYAGLSALGSSVDVHRALIERSNQALALLGGDGRLADVQVDTVTELDPMLLEGHGVVLNRATASLARVAVTSHTTIGLTLFGLGAVATVEDLSIVDGEGRGLGVYVGAGAMLDLRRAIIDGARTQALYVTSEDTAGIDGPAATLAVEDLLVRETRSLDNGLFGRGVSVVGPNGLLMLTRASIEGNREVGLEATAGGSLVASQVRVIGTRARDCAETTCIGQPGGHGVGVYDGTLDARDLTIEGSFLCGLHESNPVAIGVSGVVSRGNAIGLCVQGTADLASQLGAIFFDENDTDVQSTDFYVPEPPPPLL